MDGSPSPIWGYAPHPLDIMFMGGHGLYNPWCGSAEKSQSAKRREKTATDKFTLARGKVEAAWIGNKVRVIQLGCKPESASMFRLLPSVSIEQIVDYVRPKPAAAAAVVTASSTPTKATAANVKAAPAKAAVDDEEEAATAVDVMDSLYEPGTKMVIPLLEPNCHLTGPCWRDFSRAVRDHAGWDVKRIEATPEEKKTFRETRKGKVFFISAIYTVPGGPSKKKKKRAKKAATSTKQEAEGSGASKPAAKKAKTTAAKGITN